MSRLLLCLGAAAACLLQTAALAQAPGSGVVTALYVEHAPGVLVAQSVNPRHRGAIWAEVRGPGSEARLFRVPDGARLAPGDRFPPSLAGPSSATGAGTRLDGARAAVTAAPPCLPR